MHLDDGHTTALSKLELNRAKGRYVSQEDAVMSYVMSVNDILVYDLRNVSTRMTNCFVQKQCTDMVGSQSPVFQLDYHAYPQPKQIISLKLQSMRMIFVLDFVLQVQDILYGAMVTETVQAVQPTRDNGAYNLAEAGNSHIQAGCEKRQKKFKPGFELKSLVRMV